MHTSSLALRLLTDNPKTMDTPIPRALDPHFTGNATVKDIVIGMSDGLTVPFALAAGLSAAVSSSFVVLVAGIAELAAGSIAMGLGGYLAARGDLDHYATEKAREQRHIRQAPEEESNEVRDILASYGLQGRILDQAVVSITATPRRWVDFMLRNELSLDQPNPQRARNSALTIGGSYIAGGILPLFPYALNLPVAHALAWSASLTLIALAAFGAMKGKAAGTGMARSAGETALIGSLAAAAAYGLASSVSRFG